MPEKYRVPTGSCLVEATANISSVMEKPRRRRAGTVKLASTRWDSEIAMSE